MVSHRNTSDGLRKTPLPILEAVGEGLNSLVHRWRSTTTVERKKNCRKRVLLIYAFNVNTLDFINYECHVKNSDFLQRVSAERQRVCANNESLFVVRPDPSGGGDYD